MATISTIATPALSYGQQSMPRKNNFSKVVQVGRGASLAQGFTVAVRPQRKTGGRGALTTTYSAASEIFRIAAIMNGLVLVGVAVGFVLLRVESALEESE